MNDIEKFAFELSKTNTVKKIEKVYNDEWEELKHGFYYKIAIESPVRIENKGEWHVSEKRRSTVVYIIHPTESNEIKEFMRDTIYAEGFYIAFNNENVMGYDYDILLHINKREQSREEIEQTIKIIVNKVKRLMISNGIKSVPGDADVWSI